MKLLHTELYDIMDNPIIVADSNYSVIYLNSSAQNFLKIESNNDVIGIPISLLVNFLNYKIESLIEINNIKRCKLEAYIYSDNSKIRCNGFVEKCKYENEEYVVIILCPPYDGESHGKEEGIAGDGLMENCRISIESPDSVGLYKNIFDNTPTGIIVEDDDLISFINNAACEMLDTDRRCIGQPLSDFIKIEDIERGNSNLNYNMLEQNENPTIIDKKIICRSGKTFFAQFKTICDVSDDKVRPVYLFRNITYRVQRENRLIYMNDDIYNILYNIPVYIVAFVNNKLFSFNKMVENHVGKELDREIDIQDFFNNFEEKDIIKVKKMYMNSYLKHTSSGFEEVEMKTRDNKTEVAEICFVGFKTYSGNTVAIVIRAIGEIYKKQLNKIKFQEALKYDNLKSEFISNLSHEFRTPLNLIISTLQVIEKSSNIYNKKYHGIIKSNTYRLIRLISNWIDLTKMTSNDFEFEFKDMDIVKVVEDITMAAVKKIEDAGRKIIFDTDIEEKIIGFYKECIERVILNILSNAVKFSENGDEISVEINDMSDRIKISITDSGVGISKAMQDRIFDKFVQNEELFTRCHEGSGLGLSVAKAIVDKHRGKITVNSTKGSGSCFVVELPCVLCGNDNHEEDQVYEEIKMRDMVDIEFSDIYL